MSDAWAAPTATRPLDAVVRLPGSKSLTNRFLVLAALADEPSRLRRPLRSRDSLLMAQALRALGADVREEPGEDGDEAAPDWVVQPLGGHDGDLDRVSVDVGLAGTVMRFLPPVAALSGRTVRFDGDERIRRRPIAPLLQSLRDLGVQVEDSDGFLPATVHGVRRLSGGEVSIDASESSQFLSGLLMVGARFPDGLTLRHVGAELPSRPHVAMTVENLRDCGVVVDDSVDGVWRVEPGPIGSLDVDVEPDLSNAGPFLAAALVAGGRVVVPGWPQHTTQAGDSLRDILDAMGADVHLDREGLTVRGSGTVSGIDLDLHDAGEIAPTVAGLAALADTPSRLRGIGHLRGHETDRLAALAHEINSLGGDVRVLPDGLEIRPRPMHGGRWGSYADHRMATTGALVGLRVPGVLVDDVATTGKTLPDFPGMWQALLDAQVDAAVQR